MPAAQRAIVAVTNDLSTDRRVARTCQILQECGYEVFLFGRKLPNMLPLERNYATKRLGLLFNKGPLFYAEFNLRALLFMLFKPADLIVSNDLDTLLACRIASRLKACELLYDSHEYFTEVPELSGRLSRTVWLAIEKAIFPKLKWVITVNDSIADAYAVRYGKRPSVVRNLQAMPPVTLERKRKELGIPEEKFVLILQGAGINVDRGGEEAILAMTQLATCYLLIIGSGDAWSKLEELVHKHNLENRVKLIQRLPYQELMQYTANADLGLSLDKGESLNYRFSLPNKVFDYLNAGIPVLSTDLPELRKVITAHDAGVLIPDNSPEEIVKALRKMITEPGMVARLKENAKFAASQLAPEKEEEQLRRIIRGIE